MVRQIVVAYDIIKNSRRVRVAKFLKGFMDRVQKSVFEGQLQGKEMERLRQGMARRIDREQDTVRLYTLCKRCREATEIIGTGVYIEEKDNDIVV